jgi:hypothetical protein
MTDPSEANNLKRGFETVLQDMLRGIEAELTDPSRRSRFDDDAASVREFIKISEGRIRFRRTGYLEVADAHHLSGGS